MVQKLGGVIFLKIKKQKSDLGTFFFIFGDHVLSKTEPINKEPPMKDLTKRILLKRSALRCTRPVGVGNRFSALTS